MALNVAGARNTDDLAYDRANILLTRNSILSDQMDRVLSLLEGGDGSRLLSDEITDIIANFPIAGRGSINSVPNEKRELVARKSLKEKLSYFLSRNYTGRVAVIVDTNLVDDARNYLGQIETRLNQMTNLSQKFIIRHAAINRFNVSLNIGEKQLLDNTINKIQKLVSDANLNHYTFHFSQKTDTQKIKKIEEAIRMINNSNITQEQKNELSSISTEAAPLFEKLKPLEELDVAYENMSNALNGMYTNNRDGMHVLSKSAMILQSRDIRRLKIALSVIEDKDRKTFNIENYTKKLITDGNTNVSIALDEVLSHEKIREALKKANMTEEIFSRSFLEYFSQELVIQAKARLDWVKKKTFKTNTKDFEQDVNNLREGQRRKIITIGDAILGGRPRFVGAARLPNADERFILQSYLNKNKHIFRLGVNALDNESITRTLELAIEDNCPNATPQERNILRDTILDQNANVNGIFYGDNNPFDRKDQTDNPIYSVINHARRIADQTSVLSKNYGQTAAKFLIGGGTIAGAGMAVSAVGIPAILAGLGIAVGGKLLAKGTDKGLKNYHEWLNKDRKGWRNVCTFPLKMAKLITKPLEFTGHGIDKGTDKLPGIISNTKKRVDNAVLNHIGNKEWVKNLTNDKVDGLFGACALGLNGLVRGSTELTSLVSNVGMDIGDTAEKRRLLEGIYSTENAQNLQEFADQTHIQALLHEDMGLYEHDGYVDNLEASKEKGILEKEVKEYEDAPLNDLAQVVAAEALKVPLDALILALPDGQRKTELQIRIINRTSLVANARIVFQARVAVETYETAPINDLIQITHTESLKNPANLAVNLITDATEKTALQARIDTKKTLVNEAKVPLLASTTAVNAVVAYESAPVTTLAEITVAENLKTLVDRKVDAVDDAVMKNNLEIRVINRTTIISSRKTLFESEDKAENTTLAYENAPITTLEEINLAERLRRPADIAVLALLAVVRVPFVTRITNKAADISRERARLENERDRQNALRNINPSNINSTSWIDESVTSLVSTIISRPVSVGDEIVLGSRTLDSYITMTVRNIITSPSRLSVDIFVKKAGKEPEIILDQVVDLNGTSHTIEWTNGTTGIRKSEHFSEYHIF